MKELVPLMEKAGKHVTLVAPTVSESRGTLKDEGFQDAETVDKLLSSPDMKAALKGQVLICDEGGLLGTKKATALLELAEKQDCRLIFVGDTRQHSSVERGDALRILNTVGGIKTAEVSRIFRQRNIHYRAAVEDLSKGDVKTAFEKLDGIEFIKSVDPMNPHARLTDDYVAALKKGKTALVISPTHKQGDEATSAIREKLRKAGLIGKKEIAASRLVNLNLTEAEKSDWRNFKEGQQIVQFNQHVKGAKRGSTWAVASVRETLVELRNDKGQSLILPQDKAGMFDLFHKTEIGLSKGDKVRITRTAFDEQNRRMDNGWMFDVVSVSKNGGITLRNPSGKTTYVLGKEFGHLAHAYCVTSHNSQGKTVDEVFIHQPAATFPATDAKQFYVSVSRGRDAAHIYTDDKDALLDHAVRLGDRQSALELVGGMDKHLEHIRQLQRQPDAKSAVTKQPIKETPLKYTIDRDYEPGL
nr:AAA family ATPase [Chitinophaga pendula]